MGLLDDRFALSPWTRLPVQIAAGLVLTYVAGVMTTFGAPFGGGDVTLSGWGAHTFTVLVTVAAINAFSMLDGMERLAGAVTLVAFAD